jgi:integrase
MHKINSKNERIKRRFFHWLKEANGRSDSTVQMAAKAIWLYEDFAKGADLATFNADNAVAFKKSLFESNRKEPLALSTISGHTIHLRQFFKWLSQQSGYKSKITPDTADYLKLSKKEECMARQTSPRNYPPLEHVVKLADSIEPKNEIASRDRALIAFTLLSGMRDQAIVTLPMGCFDKTKRAIDQNPRKGVKTKFSKLIPTALFPFDEKLLDYFLQWHSHLESKGFGSQAPLFPHAKAERGTDGLSFESATEVEPVFWQGTGRMREIFKKRSQEAALPYFPPHSYRHLAQDLAMKSCRTGEQIKAVSQNLGHEHIATTLSAYGTLSPERLSQVVGSLKPSGTPTNTAESTLVKIQELLGNKML